MPGEMSVVFYRFKSEISCIKIYNRERVCGRFTDRLRAPCTEADRGKCRTFGIYEETFLFPLTNISIGGIL
jgi:hypothetical protein